MKNTAAGQPFYYWVILLILAFIWGSSFILMKRALFDTSGGNAMSNFDLAALRLVIAACALSFWGLRTLRKVKPVDIVPLLLVGFCGNAFPAILFTTAQLHMDSLLAGILNSLTPVFTLLIAMSVFGIRYLRLQIVGVFVGLLGAMGLIFSQKDSLSGEFGYALMVVFATFLYAISVNTIRNRLSHFNAFEIAGTSLLFVLPVALGVLLFQGSLLELVSTNSYAWQAIGYVTMLALVGTALALVLFNFLIARTTAIFASSVTYVMPVFAIMWGVLTSESLRLGHILWTLVILSGVYLINRKKVAI